MVFESEQARSEAILALGDDPRNLTKLDEMRSAEIKKVEEASKDEAPKVEPPKVEEEASKATETKAEEEPKVEPKNEELESARELIRQQAEFIKSRWKPEVRQEPAPPKSEDVKEERKDDIGEEIQRIDSLIEDLEKQTVADPDVAFTGAYQAKVRELNKLQAKNIRDLAKLYSDSKNETMKVISEFRDRDRRGKEERRREEAVTSVYREIDELDIPEIKLSKKTKDIEAEYIKWRADVGMAYYGRPVGVDEQMQALQQLQVKNPELVGKCKLSGVATEPTDDLKRYLELCKIKDYQLGWRKDPATGEMVRLVKYDPQSGNTVPLVLPSIKAAIQQKRVEEGYYDKKVDESFQKGAESLAKAASRRDQGAIELNSDQGKSALTIDWAQKFLSETDAEKAMIEYRKGKPGMLEEINKARKLLTLEPISFD